MKAFFTLPVLVALCAFSASEPARAAEPVLITTSTNLPAGSLEFEGRDFVVEAGVFTIEGDHQLGSLVVRPDAQVEFKGTNLVVAGLELRGSSRFQLAGGGILRATGDVRLLDTSSFVVLGKDAGARVDGVWRGAGGRIEAANLAIAAGARLTADQQGYAGGAGPGAGLAVDSGAGHGGRGGSRGTPGGATYGSASEPVDMGSGGVGSGMWGTWSDPGIGGGAIRVVVSGALTLDGSISANGGDAILHIAPACCAWGSGGAGGSLWIQAGAVLGNGQLQAKGGRGSGEGNAGAGGGGGRIALYCDNAEDVIGRVLVTVEGGQGVGNAAQIGTVSYWNTQLGSGRYALLLPGTRFDWPDGQTLRLETLRAWQQAEIAAGVDSAFHVAGNCTLASGTTMSLGGGSRLAVAGTLSLAESNCVLVMGSKNTSAMVAGAWEGAGGFIEAGNVTVAAGASISADAQGYTEGAGPGAGGDSGVGGGHGGLGGGANGANGGSTYGSVNEPTQPGSGGRGSSRWGTWAYGGAGGGALRMKVAGELALDGTISADGGSATSVAAGDCCASGSGGAGGSVWIETGTIRGAGLVRARGGNGAAGGAGGGGGRLAVHYAADRGFTGIGSCSAQGGTGDSRPGQTGTLGFWNSALNSLLVLGERFEWPAGQTLQVGALRVAANANGPARFTLGDAARLEAANLALSAGAGLFCGADAAVLVSGDVTLEQVASIKMAAAGALIVAGTLNLSGPGCEIDIGSKNNTAPVDGRWVGESARIHAGNIQVAAGAQITGAGRGYPPGAGPGAADGPGTGGGYGGLGGGSSGADSGLTYGSPWEPGDLGSGGQGSSRWGTWAVGGFGGGALRIEVEGTLRLDGVITADGSEAVFYAAGDCCASGSGGSGGSVWIKTRTLVGAGVVRALGGKGTAGGASGGGGRVAVYYERDGGYTGFAQCSVAGGADAPAGQSGTLGFFQTGEGMEPPSLLVPRERFVCANGSSVRVGALTIGWPGASNAVVEIGEQVTFRARDVSVQQGASMSVGGGSVFELSGTFRVQDSNSLVLVQGRDAWGMISNQWAGVGSTIRASNIVVGAGARISADAQGYGYSWNAPAHGPGAPRRTAAGAGHGGTTPQGGLAYGADFAPTDLGSGGSGSEGWSNATRGGSGGGAIHLVATGTARIDGEITADGDTAVNHPSPWGCCAAGGGGAGGSVFVEARTMEGSGTISANGGTGIYGASGGAGGRLAIWTWVANTVPAANLQALAGEGTPASERSENGTVRVSGSPFLAWNPTPNPNAHGGQILSWAAVGLDVTHVYADATVYRDGLAYAVARGLRNFDRALWDTTLGPDGRYEAKVVFRNLADEVVGELAASVFVNNAARWHQGALAASATWSKDTIHLIESDLVIGNGVTLTLEPGAVIKVLPGRRVTVAPGGRLEAPATELLPIVFTVLEDDTAGGDTNFDGDRSRPQPGSWPGLIVSGGTADLSPFVQVRYARIAHSGALAANETWLGAALHDVVGDVTVPAGVTLTIEPGAVVKFAAKRNLRVVGTLNALGTLAQPVTFTSDRDDAVGGDSNADGDATRPAAGDWGMIEIGGEVNLAHARLTYGGGTAGGGYEWGAGTIRTGAGAVLRLGDSVLSQSAFEGIHATGGGDITVSNTVIAFTDRALNADGALARLVHCTLYKNRIGLWPHGGVIQARNTLISHSLETGVYAENHVQFCNVWSPTGNNGNVTPGTAGNLSIDPRFKNAEAGDFRLDYRSPCIDAADGAAAPDTDAMGAPRYSDPRTPVKTGTPTPTGAYADMGAFEFVEEAESPIDLVVTAVRGPSEATAGAPAAIEWVIANRGTAPAQGPWHDGIRLAPVHGADADALIVAEAVSAVGITLGPGQTWTNRIVVRVPGGTAGDYRWQVLANPREDVFEGRNLANNTGTSAGTTKLTVPRLGIDGSVASGSFTGPGAAYWYVLAVDQPRDIRLRLDMLDDQARSGLYVGRGYMPTPQHFDQRQNEWNAADATVTIAAVPGETYYLLLEARSLPGAGTFQFSAAPVDFSLTAARPGVCGSHGPVTVRVDGGRLAETMRFRLTGPAGIVREATQIFLVNSGCAFVTFDATGLPIGAYTLSVDAEGVVRSLADALQVVPAARPGTVDYRIDLPTFLRPGLPGALRLEYFNAGDNDALAPIIQLVGHGAAFQWPESSGHPLGPATNRLCWVGIHHEGPAGVLPPGAREEVYLDVLATVPDGRAQVVVETGRPDDAMNWDPVSDSNYLLSLPVEARPLVLSNFFAEVGRTVREAQANLAANATHLSRLGIYTDNLDRLVQFELRRADDFGRLSRRYLLGPRGRGSTPEAPMAETQANGFVRVLSPTATRWFQPQPDGSFASATGDHGLLTRSNGLLRLREKDGSVVQFRPDGLADHRESPNGQRLLYQYTGSALTAVVDSFGNRTNFAYNPQGRVSAITDPVGRVTRFDYDPAGEHLVAVTTARGVESLTYAGPAGAANAHALASRRFSDGTYESYSYDQRGRLLEIGGPRSGRPVRYRYGPGGALSITDAAGAVWLMLLDDAGQLAMARSPAGQVTRLDWDAHHNLTRTDGPYPGPTRQRFDAAGNLIEHTDPRDAVTAFGYDERLYRLAEFRSARGFAIQLEHDSGGNLQRIVHPDGAVEERERDAWGRPVLERNARGLATAYAYDARNWITNRIGPDGVATAMRPDERGNPIEIQERDQVTRLAYDQADRLTRIEYPNGRWLAFAYDAAGRRQRLETFDGHAINYSYDAGGRLQRLTDAMGRVLVQYVYDAAGRLARVDRPNGTSSQYAYTADGHIRQIVHAGPTEAWLDRLDYRYDDYGQVVEARSTEGVWTYEYDRASQLTRARFAPSAGAGTPRDLAYEYDAGGNLLRTVANAALTPFMANARDQYTGVGGAGGRHDADGNLAAWTDEAGAWTYTYDARNRLTGINAPDGAWQFEYTALGHRAAVVHNGQRIDWLVDPVGAADLVAEYGPDGTVLARYVHGVGLVCQLESTEQRAYYAFDLVGNTHALLGDDGGILETYRYEPFGALMSGPGTRRNIFRFGGQWGVVDDGHDLLFMRARYYAPHWARFTSPDPGRLSLPNRYAYAYNNPLSYIDPLGTVASVRGWGPWNPQGNSGSIVDDPHNVTPEQMWHDTDHTQQQIHTVYTVTTNSVILDPPGSFWEIPKIIANFWPIIEDGPFHHPEPQKTNATQVLHSYDPNQIVGPAGFGELRWIDGRQVLVYTIQFENDPEKASLPAQTVAITHRLSVDLDWSSFRLAGLNLGGRDHPVPPGLQEYAARLDLRPTCGLVVDLEAGLDPADGRVHWEFRSIDPRTGRATRDPIAGFLPPNTNAPAGEGWVRFTIAPKTTLPSDTRIAAQARIVFDVNEPIDTNTHTNRVDATPPGSSVDVYPTDNPRLVGLSIGASDHQSGLAGFDVYVSREGSPYQLWAAGLAERQVPFAGEPGVEYRFFSIAHDAVGNVEPIKAVWDAVVTLDFAMLPLVVEAADPPRVVLRWESSHGLRYAVQRTENLEGEPFTTIAGPLESTPPLNVFADDAPSDRPRFYRVLKWR